MPNKKRLLLVDDDRIHLKIISNKFSETSNEIEIFTAPNGEAAMEIVEKHLFSIIITGLNMPGLDGLGLIKRLYKEYPEIPVIVIAASKENEFLFPPNIVHLFVKPFAITHLITLASNILSQSKIEGSVQGISIGTILQMLETEQKTCTLNVHSPDNKTGSFYFSEGVLYDAAFCGEYGESAAYELIQLETPKFSITAGIPKEFAFKRRISGSVTGLLMESMQKLDEKLRNSENGLEDQCYQPINSHLKSKLNLNLKHLKKKLSQLKLIDGFISLALLDSKGRIIFSHRSPSLPNLEETIFYFNRNLDTQDMGFGTIHDSLFITEHWNVHFRGIHTPSYGDLRLYLIMTKSSNQAMTRLKMRQALEALE